MTTVFDKTLGGFAFSDTYYGDTLQKIAARLLGDAGLWYQLISPNGLVPPYITDDPTQAGAGVLLSGQPILVPSPSVTATTVDPQEVFGTDIQLQSGLLQADSNGDFAFVTGRANLSQALSNRISTERGELIYHTGYGSLLRSIIGTGNGPATELLAASTAKTAVLADPRISSINQAVATSSGDSVSVSVEAVPIMGQALQVVGGT
jgi:phage baseplate assembly protein W